MLWYAYVLVYRNALTIRDEEMFRVSWCTFVNLFELACVGLCTAEVLYSP